MKRTKDGGAILYHGDGTQIKLTRAEFIQSRFLRDLGRIGLIIVATVIDLAVMRTSGLFTIGIILVMLGWRLKVGW